MEHGTNAARSSSSTSKVVILTGASRGIGLAIAEYLLAQPEGHKVVLVARTAGPLKMLKEKYGERVSAVVGDVADFDLAAGVIASTLKSFSRIDTLILNHGTLDPVQKIASTPVSSWRSAFDINVFGSLSFITAAIPSLRASKGRILVTSSGAALSAYSTWGAYGASKATLNHIVMTLAVEEPDITSIAVRPGVVDTQMQEAIREVHYGVMDEKDMKKFRGLHESGGLLKPEQPGHVMAKMAVTEMGLESLSGGFWSWNAPELASFQHPLEGKV